MWRRTDLKVPPMAAPPLNKKTCVLPRATMCPSQIIDLFTRNVRIYFPGLGTPKLAWLTTCCSMLIVFCLLLDRCSWLCFGQLLRIFCNILTFKWGPPVALFTSVLYVFHPWGCVTTSKWGGAHCMVSSQWALGLEWARHTNIQRRVVYTRRTFM